MNTSLLKYVKLKLYTKNDFLFPEKWKEIVNKIYSFPDEAENN